MILLVQDRRHGSGRRDSHPRLGSCARIDWLALTWARRPAPRLSAKWAVKLVPVTASRVGCA
jgi:hypothetical protein